MADIKGWILNLLLAQKEKKEAEKAFCLLKKYSKKRREHDAQKKSGKKLHRNP